MLLPEWSTAVFLFISFLCDSYSWVPCLSWTVKLSAVLQKNPSGSLQILWFSSIFVYLNPFQQLLYDFDIHIFTPRTTEGLICNYSRRFKHSLMLQKKKHALRDRAWKLLNRMKMCIFFLFCLNIIVLHLVRPFRSYRRYLPVFLQTN